MAVRHTRVDYLKAALLGDEVAVATWIVDSDGRLRCTRRFDIIRDGDGARLLEAEIDYCCLNLDSGRPTRMPAEFAAYRPDPQVLAAIDTLPAGHRRITGAASRRGDPTALD
jgi:acyl-CoA thioester hydrolase